MPPGMVTAVSVNSTIRMFLWKIRLIRHGCLYARVREYIIKVLLHDNLADTAIGHTADADSTLVAVDAAAVEVEGGICVTGR